MNQKFPLKGIETNTTCASEKEGSYGMNQKFPLKGIETYLLVVSRNNKSLA